MKSILFIYLTMLTCSAFISCKKSNDAVAAAGVTAGVNWKDSLQNTVWTGEFKYANGTNTPSLQPFSMELKSDGTVSWADELFIRDAGNWAVKGTEATLTFPDKTFLTAQVGRDTWSSFSNPAINGFVIDSMIAVTPARENLLTGATYKGLISGTTISMRFSAPGSVTYDEGSVSITKNYTLAGAGIRFAGAAAPLDYSNTVFAVPDRPYNVLRCMTHAILKGKHYYFTYDLVKQ